MIPKPDPRGRSSGGLSPAGGLSGAESTRGSHAATPFAITPDPNGAAAPIDGRVRSA